MKRSILLLFALVLNNNVSKAQEDLNIIGDWATDSVFLTLIPNQFYMDQVANYVDSVNQGVYSEEWFFQAFGYPMPTSPQEMIAISNGITNRTEIDFTTISFTENQMKFYSEDNFTFINYIWASDSMISTPSTFEITEGVLCSGNFTIISSSNYATTALHNILTISTPLIINNENFYQTTSGAIVTLYCSSAEGFNPGCIDTTACNYNVNSTNDDGSCLFAETYYDCDGNCLNDVDTDGECDEIDYNDGIGVNEIEEKSKILIKMIDVLGKEHTKHEKGMVLFYIYEDGSVIKKINIE